jgi:antitoxin CcdA
MIPAQPLDIRPAKKRATNLSLSADMLKAAKALGINVSRECDRHLRMIVKREQEAQWKRENADFIVAYNV